MTANEEVVPASELRAAQLRIRELERALGKKVMEIETLQAAREEAKKEGDVASVANACGPPLERWPTLLRRDQGIGNRVPDQGSSLR